LPSVENARSIRIMTYNIHRWAGQDGRLDVGRLVDVISAAGADVIGLNEVLHPVSDPYRIYEPLSDLAGRLGMAFAFGPSGWVDYGPGWHGLVGNALLSRYPLADVSNTWLPRSTGSKQRSLLGARLGDGPAAGLHAYVTHLDHASEATRLLQIDGVLNRMPKHAHYIAGDLNTHGFMGRHSRRLLPPVLRRLRHAGYQDAFFAVGTGGGRTFPAVSPLLRLDFLFMPRSWAPGLRSARTIQHDRIWAASDHRPVVVEWGWPPVAA
jgi:endonuclease/exonuclease/phosphatase family metal-dependent hydrolase